MSWGSLSREQTQTLRRFVAKRVVHDLGTGDMSLAEELVELKASVIAIDSDSVGCSDRRGITFIRRDFCDFTDPVRTAFVSWPYARMDRDLVRIVAGAPTVIYLGNNFNGSACGGQDLWGHLLVRQVLAHVPHQRNSLIVYGKRFVRREALPEEASAIDLKKVHLFREAYPDAVTV